MDDYYCLLLSLLAAAEAEEEEEEEEEEERAREGLRTRSSWLKKISSPFRVGCFYLGRFRLLVLIRVARAGGRELRVRAGSVVGAVVVQVGDGPVERVEAAGQGRRRDRRVPRLGL